MLAPASVGNSSRARFPPGGSTLRTSAPRSANRRVTSSALPLDRSRTRTASSNPSNICSRYLPGIGYAINLAFCLAGIQIASSACEFGANLSRGSRLQRHPLSSQTVSAHLSYVEAVVVGAFQGVTELFPVSSLGHAVLVPALVGGQWAQDLDVSAPGSPYLAFIVGLHVATAAALLVFFWRDWLRIVAGVVSSVRYRRVQTPAERLGWVCILGTIPGGLAGLALEHLFRTTLGRPIPAAAFLLLNGIALYAGEVLRRRVSPTGGTDGPDHAHTGEAVDNRLAQLPM